MKEIGNSISRFMSLFDRLKYECGDNPERLKVFYGQSASVKDAADQLFQFVGWGHFERNVFHGSGKLVSGAPIEFEKNWWEYQRSWSRELFDAVLNIDFSELLLSMEQTVDQTKSVEATRQAPDVEAPNPEEDCNFDPLSMDGAKAFEMAFQAAEVRAENVGGQWEDDLSRASNIGLEAYSYLTGTIGFAPGEVFRRWRSLPVFFMPGHLAPKHSEAPKDELHEMLDNAIRAYVFGANLAAIAMCRATLELVLKRHYRLDHSLTDAKGNIREKRLGELIKLARKNDTSKLPNTIETFVNWANQVLHSNWHQKSFDREHELKLIEFFKTIKIVITLAPTSPSNVPEEDRNERETSGAVAAR